MPSEPASPAPKARFTTGSTMRHVAVMTAAGGMGLVAIFLVDFANLFYISLLGNPVLTAAVGYAGTVLYFHMSFSVGLMIAAVALASRALGAADRAKARQVSTSALVLVTAVTGILTLISLPLIGPLLDLLGAAGDARTYAAIYMWIVLPTTPFLGLVMCLIGVLRAVGDARRSMYVTLLLGLVTAALDPLLIYVLGMGVTGAAIVAVIARILALAYALWAVIHVHNLVQRPRLADTMADLPALASIGLPAVLTNVATPVGNGFVTAEISAFGDHAVAGWTIVGRLIPVAFGVLFALSGAIGPIIGQNYGAHLFDRVRRTMTDAMIFTTLYTLAISAVLFLARNEIAAAFGASGEDAELVVFFCTFLSVTFIFSGGLFVANAAFNNLGFPLLSTLFNWGRATLGTFPFVWLGARLAGADGVLAGFALGGIPFGLIALFVCYRVIGRLGADPESVQRSPVLRALAAISWGRPAPRHG